MKKFFFLLLLLQVVILNAQDEVSVEFVGDTWKASYPHELPPREILNDIDTIRPGLYRASIGSNAGFYNGEFFQGYFNDTATIIPFEYHFLPRKYSNFMLVKNDKAGAIDSLNNFIIPMIYSSLSPLHQDIPLLENKYLKAWLGKKMGLIDFTGKVKVPIAYRKISEVGKDVFVVQNEGKLFGIVDLNNNVFTNCKYNEGVQILKTGFYKTINKEIKNGQVNRKFGCMDSTGNDIVPPIFKKIELSSDGKHIIAFDGKGSKIYDVQGKLVFEKEEVEMKNLVKGMFTFFQARKKYIVKSESWEEVVLKNRDIKRITDDLYLDSEVFQHRSQWLSTKISGVKNYSGEEVLPIKFDEIIYANDNLFFASQKGNALFGIYNLRGKEITAPKYSFVKTNGEFSTVCKPDAWKFSLVDKMGNELTPFIYDEIIFKKVNFRKGDIEILGKRGEMVVVLDTAGKEIQIKEHPLWYRYDFNFVKSNQSNFKISQGLKGNRYRYLLQEDILIQYIFNSDSSGTKIFFIKDEEGNRHTMKIPFFRTVSGTGFSPWKDMLWLFFDIGKNINDHPSSMIKKLENIGELKKMEAYPIKAKYPYNNTFSDQLFYSTIDWQNAIEEEKEKLKTLLLIQAKLEKEMVYQPLYQETAPKIWIDLETQECFLINLKSSKLRFSKVYFKNGNWYLGSAPRDESNQEGQNYFLYFNDINYLDQNQKINQGQLRLNYQEHSQFSNLVH